jgi:GntR family transcriptional regulator, arabinose operon transcriptional repressor
MLTSPSPFREKLPRQPKYQQVRDHLYAEISSGRLAPGVALPTEVELCEQHGMSRNTLRQALSDLESQGLIERIQGRGTFVTNEQQRHARRQLDMFACIVPQVREGVYPSLIQGFEQACAGLQHQMIVGNSGNDVVRQGDLILQMIDQTVGGVALVPTTVPATPVYQIRQLQKHHIPVVFCHRTVPGIAAPSLLFSGQEGGLKAGRALCNLGHRKIAFFFAHLYFMMESYGQGLREAFVEREMNPDRVVFVEYGEKLSAPCAESERAIRAALAKLFAEADRPTAIFCGSSTDAEVIYFEAHALGLKIPGDLSLIHFGSTWRKPGLAQRLSCIAVDEFEMGASAVRLLHEMRAGQRPLDSNEQIVFPASLLPGETLGPARKE